MCRRPVQIKRLRGLQGFVSMIVAAAAAVDVAVVFAVVAAAAVDVLRCCCNHVVVDWGAITLRLMTSML